MLLTIKLESNIQYINSIHAWNESEALSTIYKI